MVTKDEIRELLRRLDGSMADDLEDEQIEFKHMETDLKTLHKTLRETVVCLANARGGTIILGVRDRVRSRRDAIQGVGQLDEAGIPRAVYDGTDPHILVEVEELIEPEGRLLLIRVPKGMPPHTTSEGMAKIRVGKECKPLTGRLFAQLLAAGGQRDPTAEVIPSASFDDISSKELDELRRLIEREAQARSLAQLDEKSLLEALGLTTPEGITLASLLLLGSEEALRRLAPQHEVSFLRYRSATRYDQRKDMRGPLLLILRELEQLVSTNNRIRTIQEEGFGQLEFPDLSWEVAREAVLNAVTHRDYFLRQGVQIGLYRDRLEIDSPGGFIGGVNPNNVLRHPPVHRNELLARVFQTVGLVNRVGLGVDRIYHELLRLGKDFPRYEADETHVRLSVPLDSHEGFAAFVVREERTGRTLDLDELILLRALAGTSSLDRWSAATALQLPEEGAAERLIRLREKGYLIVRGRGRGAIYDLKRDLADRLRGRAAVDAHLALDREAVRLRIFALLKERGRLSNAEIRRFSGFNRNEVYRLLKEMESDGRIRFEGRGRGAHIIAVRDK